MGRGKEADGTRDGRLYVGFFSALDYWRGVSNLGSYQDNVQLIRDGSDPIGHYRVAYASEHEVARPLCRVADIKALGITLSGEAPLDILISSPRERVRAKRILPHLVSHSLPRHSFVQAREHVLVASPEATFLQLAQCLTLPQLLLVGMELCGTYCFDGSGLDGTGFTQRPRLLTVERLRQYLSWCRGIDGIDQARRAARLLLNNSASPGESHAVLALTLPRRLRGLGLPRPKLNHRTQVTLRNREGTDQTQYYYDFYWTALKRARAGQAARKRRVDGEYDSDEHHSGTLQMHEDARRGNSVQYMGTAHLVITSQDLRSARDLIMLARQLARCLWLRLPPKEQLDALEPRLDELLVELREGKSYPVSLDSCGRLPLNRRRPPEGPRHGVARVKTTSEGQSKLPQQVTPIAPATRAPRTAQSKTAG